MWSAEWVTLAGLLAYTGLISAAAGVLSRALHGYWLIGVQAILAIIPGVAWLAFFYLQDRREPEPKHYVAGVFLLGAGLAKLVAIPLAQDGFGLAEWLYRTPWGLIAGSILVVGALQEFLKYAAVRYTVYHTAEFSEPVDGIVYATAAGLGFATMLNLDYVLAHQGVDLTVGIVRIVVTALAHASFAGVLGYCMGQAKFRAGGDTWPLVGGIALSSVLNGLFFYAQGEVTSDGLRYLPWNGLALATALAVVVFLALHALMRRAGHRAGRREAERRTHFWAEDVPVFLLVAAMLAGGAAVRSAVLEQRVAFAAADGSLQAELPAGWLKSRDAAYLVKVRNPASGSPFMTELAIRRERIDPAAAAGGLETLVSIASLEKGQSLDYYRQLSAGPVEVAGQPGLRLEYAYVTDPHQSFLLDAPLPVVVQAAEIYVIDGDQLVTVEFAADHAVYAKESGYLERLLQSLVL